MQVDNTSGLGLLQSPEPPRTEDNNPGEIGQEAFLRLLIAQLEHQDPLSPIENNEFTTQLAQFNTLQQMETMNVNLTSLLDAQESMNGFQASNLIGKQVHAQGNTIQLSAGQGTSLQYKLAGDSANTTINIYGQDGNLIYSLATGNQTSGDQIVDWDGRNAQGGLAPDGAYTFTVSAVDHNGKQINADTFIQGTVEGIEFVNKHPQLLINGNQIELSSIIRVTEENAPQ